MIVSLQDVLTMLATGVGVGAVIAFFLEKVGFFQNLSPTVKTWLTMSVCLLLPLTAWLGKMALGYVSWPLGSTAWIEGVFHELAIGFITWAASQGWHLTEVAARK